MSLFDEAAEFMKNRPAPEQKKSEHDELMKHIRAEFENATITEIERALDRLSEQGEIPTDVREVIKKIRIWLED